MHKPVLIAALLAMSLTATPALAQSPSAPGDVPIGRVTEDGLVRTSSDTFAECSPELPEPLVRQYAGACAEAGFPILDAQPSDTPVSAGTPPEPAARASSAGGSTSAGGGGSVGTTLPDTGGPPLLLVADGLLLAGVGLVARRSTR